MSSQLCLPMQEVPPEVWQKIRAGMQLADDHADPKWKHVFDACVLAVARKLPELTSDDVLAEFELLKVQPNTHTEKAIGPCMLRARSMGILVATDRVVRSERPRKHGNRHQVWKSNYWRAE